MWRKKAVKEFAAQAAERLIDKLERGVAPWQKGWDTPSAANRPPHNPVSGTRYRGLNSLVLRMEADERGYSDPRWMTYQHAKKIDAHVRKGERGTRIEFWAPVKPKPEEAGKDSGEKPEEPAQRFALVRAYRVFNGEQIENLPPLKHDHPQQWEVSERAERLLQASEANIEHRGGDRAFYHIRDDKIVLPRQEQFRTPEAYYSTAMHELGHWTGHKDRLNRETLQQGVKDGFGSEQLRQGRAAGGDDFDDGERHAQPAARSRAPCLLRGLLDQGAQEQPRRDPACGADAGAAADYILEFDRDRPRDLTDASRQADTSSPLPERQRESAAQPEKQPERTREMSWDR